MAASVSKLIQKEKQNLKNNAESKPHPFNLSDIVMMQMVGDFDRFLENLPKNGEGFGKADEMIEETKKEVTVQKLFPSIVDKTITAQLGNEHATLRELGQNGMDSYNPREIDRKVVFDVEEDEDIVMRTRDFGSGMNLEEMVRDLLVPYNSGKEFDLTKIGEHGIGWYSIVDLADLVKVTSRKKDSKKSSQALVYKKGDNWEVLLSPNSKNGFYKKLDLVPKGTEVTAFIPKEKTNVQNIKDFLFQYLGMVNRRQAQITLNGKDINKLRESYQVGIPIPIIMKDKMGNLQVGVSKREIKGCFSDPRFKHRNQNLDKILYTQNGLFIKYDSHPFDEKSVHGQLSHDLMGIGLDLWTEIPDFITLTKGRNNIIANDWPKILDAMYQGFESMFLDVLLNDEEMLYHPSNFLLKSVADVFNREYSGYVEIKERNKYAPKRRALSRISSGGSKIIDLGGFLARNSLKYSAKFAKGSFFLSGKMLQYGFTSLPKDIIKSGENAKEYFSENKEKIKKGIQKSSLVAVSSAAVGTSSYLIGNQIYKHFSWDLIKYGAMALGGSALIGGAGVLGYAAVKNWPGIKKGTAKFLDDLVEIGSKKEILSGSKPLMYGYGLVVKGQELVRKIPGKIKNSSLYIGGKISRVPGKIMDVAEGLKDHLELFGSILLKSCGLYNNLDEKRNKKIAKKVRKISSKYISFVCKDAFMKKIMGKEIIPAEFFYSENNKKKREKKKTILEMFDDVVNLSFGTLEDELPDPNNLVRKNRPGPLMYQIKSNSEATPNFKKKYVKLSIDKLINAYIGRKLIYSLRGCSSNDMEMRDGEFFVDYTNPLVNTVVGRLEEITKKVNIDYDVKILEDHLENIGDFAKKAALCGYFLSGIGVVHLIATGFKKDMKNPFSNSMVYQYLNQKLRSSLNKTKGKSKFVQTLKDKWSATSNKERGEGLIKIVKTTGTYMSYAGAIPFLITKHSAIGLYEGVGKVVKPVATRLDPRKYPKYGQDMGKYFKTQARLYKERKEWVLEKKGEKKEKKERIKEIKAEEREEKLKERAKLKELRKHKRNRNSGLQGLVADCLIGIKDKIVDAYDEFPLLDIVGLGYKPNGGLIDNNLDKKDLAEIVKRSTIARGYIDFVNTIESVDKLICDVMNEDEKNNKRRQKHYKVLLNCLPGEKEFSKKKNNKLYVRLRHIGILDDFYLREINRARSKTTEYVRLDFRKSSAYDYKLLDKLLHQRTHDLLKDDEDYYFSDRHNPKFYKTKAKLRRKVIEYMGKNNVHLYEYINESISKNNDPEDPYYLTTTDYLSGLTYMTKRKLMIERINAENNRGNKEFAKHSKERYMKIDEYGDKISKS